MSVPERKKGMNKRRAHCCPPRATLLSLENLAASRDIFWLSQLERGMRQRPGVLINTLQRTRPQPRMFPPEVEANPRGN